MAVFGQKEFKGYKDRSNLYNEPAPPPAADVAPPKTDYQSEYQAMPKVEINLDDFFTKETPAEKEANAKAAKAAEAKAARQEAQRLKEEEDTAKFEADKAALQTQVTRHAGRGVQPRRRGQNPSHPHPSHPQYLSDSSLACVPLLATRADRPPCRGAKSGQGGGGRGEGAGEGADDA